MKLIYLACPYAHDDPKIRQARYESVTRATAWLLGNKSSVMVFSPITHNHPVMLASEKGLPFKHSFWLPRDIRVLRVCDQLTVLMLDGWHWSRGVKQEIRIAEENALDVEYCRPHELRAPDVPLSAPE